MRFRFTLLVFPALLAGCAVGPNYRRPGDPGPGGSSAGQTAMPEDRSLADLGWWDLYRDPVLTALVKASLANGYDARIAAARVEQARAIAMQAQGQLFPSLGYAGGAYRGKSALEGELVTRQKLAEVRAQQEYEVGAYQEAVKVALARYKAGHADYYELLQVQQELYPAEAALAQNAPGRIDFDRPTLQGTRRWLEAFRLRLVRGPVGTQALRLFRLHCPTPRRHPRRLRARAR
jgi:outer membrane protein TolC